MNGFHKGLRGLTPIRVAFPLLCCLILVGASASTAGAQDGAADAPPAHVSFVEGAVILERDGRPDDAPMSMPLLAGDRIRTQGGRAEILFADGSALHVDSHTVVDFQSDEVVRLLEGRIRLNMAGRGSGVNYRVDGPAGWVEVVEAGEYRVAVLRGERDAQLELAVLRGAAELVNENGRSLVRAGERAFASAGAQPSAPYVYNSAAWDDFDRWSESRRDQRLGASAQYLPPDVRHYSAAFDHYGSWRYEPVHGYVWYPRVHVDWRPYYHGRWTHLRPYGWTWIGADPWGWPTHHYGRWGFSAGSWYWIPGRRWGAAWVSWAYHPGYVSWCPLGWNDRPVFSFININLFGGRRYDPWRAWTLVPRGHFGSRFVHASYIRTPRFDTRVHRSFVLNDRGPRITGYAVPRASTAIRSAGVRTGYAIPRGSTAGAIRSARSAGELDAGTRGFPAPGRQPRSPSEIRGSRERPSASITAAPPRAVPRDRGAAPDGARSIERSGAGPRDGARAIERSGSAAPGTRGAPERRVQPEAPARNDAPVTMPQDRIRAVPRRSPDAGTSRSSGSNWGRSDPSSPVVTPRAAPEYRPDSGARAEPGVRSAPERAPQYERPVERYRAAPRQDAPRPSYESPREAPRSYREAPRAPRESAPPPRSYSAPERRAPAGPPASADRPSRSAPSNDGGRSRGDSPSRGQAVRRGRG